MYSTVKTIVEANAPIWEGIPGFVSLYNSFDEKRELLEGKCLIHGNSVIGVGSVLARKRLETTNKTLVIGSALKSLAHATENDELKLHVKITRSAIEHASKAKCLQMINRIILKADENVSGLVNFGILESDIDALKTLRNALTKLINSPREAIIDRSTVTGEIKQLIKVMDALLTDGIDPMVIVLHDSAESFFNSYFSARSVIHYGIRHNDPGEIPTEPDDGEE